MIRSIVFLFFFYLGVAGIWIAILPLILFRKTILWGFRLSCYWVMFALRFFGGIEYDIRGLEKIPQNRKMIVASQHQSTWETFLFHIIVRDPIYIMKSSLYFLPFAGWYGWRLNQIGINRKKGGRALDQMVRQAKKVMTEKRPLVIFPEGTRVPEGKHIPVKKGVGLLYKSLDVPIVPVVMTSGLFWHKFKLKRRGTLIVEFLDPIEPGLKASEAVQKLEDLYKENYARIRAESLASVK